MAVQSLEMACRTRRRNMAVEKLSNSSAPFLVSMFLLSFSSDHVAAVIEADQNGHCFPFLVAFGDSLTDTGNAQRIFPFEQNRASHFPYGFTFFKRPRDRFSDGRLLIDFIAQALDLKFLSPYVQAVGSSFQQGVNFATSGATASNITFLVPYTLKVQIYWLKKFKRQLQEAQANGVDKDLLPGLKSFDKALYVIFIGGNDYNARLFGFNMTVAEMIAAVPIVINQIETGIEDLYNEGARAILVVNVPPAGCTPELLSFIQGRPDEYDTIGCHMPYNSVLRTHNTFLRSTLSRLRQAHPDASIIYGDYYGITYDVLSKPTDYGMSSANLLNSCCGIGGKYNFNFTMQCGAVVPISNTTFTAPACDEPSTAINWDGVHPTEAFTQIVATSFLSGQFLEPVDAFVNCTFNFTNFIL